MALPPVHDPALARAMARLAAIAERIGRVERWPARDDHDVGDHLHAIPTVIVCLHGVVRVEGGARGREDLRPGDALVVPPGARHRHAALRTTSQLLDLGFVADLCDFELAGDGVRLWGRAPFQPYRGLCDRLLVAGPAERIESTRRLCRHLADERLASMRYPHPAIDRMCALMWRHAAGTTAQDLIDASGLRPSQAHAVFKSFFGESPKQALVGFRLALARQRLDEGATVTEAAAEAGFRTRADLTRAWRRRFGSPPSVDRAGRFSPGRRA